MAFRKRRTFNRKRFSPRRVGGVRPGRPRTKLDWVSPFNTMGTCLPFFIPACSIEEGQSCQDLGTGDPSGCCGFQTEDPLGQKHDAGTIALVNNLALQAVDSDYLVVRRILGTLWFRDILDVNLITNCFDDCSMFDAYLKRYALAVRMGLSKWSLTTLGLHAPAGTQADNRDPLDSYDFTEAGFIKQWHHYWEPPIHAGVSAYKANTIVGCCPDIETTDTVVLPTVDGDQPGYTIPGIETDCVAVPCRPGAGEICTGFRTELNTIFPPMWSWSFDIKKRIIVKADQQLDFTVGYAHPSRHRVDSIQGTPGTCVPFTQPGWGCDVGDCPSVLGDTANECADLQVTGQIRMLIEVP